MHRTNSLRSLLTAFLLAAIAAGSLVPAQPAFARPVQTALPDGFYEEQIVGGLSLPTSFAVAQDGRILITEKNGMVRVVDKGELQEDPFIDLTNEVNSSADRGLMAVAVHPRFPAVPYVYLGYTYEPPEASGNAASGARVGRVLRLEAERTNRNVARAGSGLVLVGTNSTYEHIGNPEKGDTEPFSCYDENGGFTRDCIATEGTSHTVDFIRFARDGSMFISVGDGIVNSKGNWRAQDPTSLNGKILHIDPATGNGIAANPFYDGDLTANRAKVWAMGLRNPFRFTFEPGTSNLVIGEVGNNTWEEIDRGGAGSNFGWPCYEGEEKVADWAICDPLFSGSSPATFGIYTYPHGTQPQRGAVIGGDFYTGKEYPAEYSGAYFFSDFNGGVIFAMIPDGKGGFTLREFATSAPGPIQISMGPDGNLWMLYMATGELVRLRYAIPGGTAAKGAAVLPTATPAASPASSKTVSVTAAVTSTTSTSSSVASLGAASTSTAATGEGFLTREVWTGISGKSVDDLLKSDDYPDQPSQRTTLSSLDVPRGAHDYGERLRGYLIPPLTGEYRFWIASDDGSRLLLSTDDDPTHAVQIASAPEWTPYRAWDKYPEQASPLIDLVAGERYYIEVLHKQADQKDNLSVAWQPPAGVRAVIDGKYLSPLK